MISFIGLQRFSRIIQRRAIRSDCFRLSHSQSSASQSSSVVKKQPSHADDLPSTKVSQKVKEAAKDVGYGSVIVGGLMLTGVILYVMLRELFSSKSPNGVYNAAFKLCKDDVRVQDLLGSNIKAHGEANQRGRRRHTAHQSWYDDQKRLHMAMKFYLKGTLGSGVVHLEVYENDAKDFEYRYLIVESEGGFSKKQVIVRPAELVPGVS
ncbi:Mitochondrial import inner membrane translocase subunit Tim21 [Clonorchis sinensis]|uniref:Mitochondrial import inner membrane translocase subunit Tim21 n=1 Tax=Clonorchis sinensis TaxID=79923 RepID=A0A8T1M4N6_CLOSI|nr:Mitochondrial import inner membrane translocase subunit Tim21 [Clonorchis sinensis]